MNIIYYICPVCGKEGIVKTKREKNIHTRHDGHQITVNQRAIDKWQTQSILASLKGRSAHLRKKWNDWIESQQPIPQSFFINELEELLSWTETLELTKKEGGA